MTRAWIRLVLCLVAVGSTSGVAFAASSSASFSVTATVVSSCRASLPGAAEVVYVRNSTSSVAVTCTLPTSYSIHTRAAVASTAAVQRVVGTSRNSSEVLRTGGEELPTGVQSNAIVVTITY